MSSCVLCSSPNPLLYSIAGSSPLMWLAATATHSQLQQKKLSQFQLFSPRSAAFFRVAWTTVTKTCWHKWLKRKGQESIFASPVFLFVWEILNHLKATITLSDHLIFQNFISFCKEWADCEILWKQNRFVVVPQKSQTNIDHLVFCPISAISAISATRSSSKQVKASLTFVLSQSFAPSLSYSFLCQWAPPPVCHDVCRRI